jgi:hypothetical protein
MTNDKMSVDTAQDRPMRPSDYGSPAVNWAAVAIASIFTGLLVGLAVALVVG